MIALTQEKREKLTAFINTHPDKRWTLYDAEKQRELEALRDQVALASLTAQPKAHTDLEELSFKNSMSDI